MPSLPQLSFTIEPLTKKSYGSHTGTLNYFLFSEKEKRFSQKLVWYFFYVTEGIKLSSPFLSLKKK
jgi:hypothetical protein